MSQFVEVKTAELAGAALDWAVAMAEGWESYRPEAGWIKSQFQKRVVGPIPVFGDLHTHYSPSTEWAHGGTLIDKYNIWLSGPIGDRKEWSAAIDLNNEEMRGETALIALCRAIVAAKLGDVVQVPVELVRVK